MIPSAPGINQSDAINGSIPGDTAPTGVLALTLQDAIRRGLRTNLAVISGDLNSRSATAARLTALSSLLPEVNGHVSESSQQINLEAFGFGGFPGIQPIVGPFQVFDARATLSQAVFDFSALSAWRSTKENLRSAELTARNLRDAVALAVVSLYLSATAGRARVDSEVAQVATADAEFRRATDLKQAGLVAGIDVLRAQVQLQTQQQRLIALRNEFEREKLSLSRAIGLPLGQEFALSTDMTNTPPPALTLDEAIRKSYENRTDYQAALAAQRSAEYQKKAVAAQRYPGLYFNGDYGTIGPSPKDNHGTFSAALSVQFPIFDGGRIRADVERADVLVDQRRSETADLRGRIDFDVRTAFLNLNSAREQVEVAQQSQKLAAEQLTQARDRFAAGVANNLEVVQAQQAVAVAEENVISSLYSFNLAKAALGRSIGLTQNLASEFLGVATK